MKTVAFIIALVWGIIGWAQFWLGEDPAHSGIFTMLFFILYRIERSSKQKEV